MPARSHNGPRYRNSLRILPRQRLVRREIAMPLRIRNYLRHGVAGLVGTASLALAAATLPAQYSMTVNRDRLVNAQHEPQNWLMMNGD